MRCQFCGWDNPQGKETCEKCNKPLMINEPEQQSNANQSASNNHERPTNRQVNENFNPKKTLRESDLNASKTAREASAGNKCPECGFDMEDGACANCGYSVDVKEEPKADGSAKVSDFRKTVRPQRKGEKEGKFTLTPISEETGLPEGETLSFEGNEISLNRNNTDPKNSTITSLEQAKICFKDGKWGIVDSSEYQTTFVQASQSIELKSGNLILLGNQLYRFDL
jgi:ribosomal protein L37E